MEAYIRALEKEIAKRRQVVELLTQGKKYYDSLQGEAEIVATVRESFVNFFSQIAYLTSLVKMFTSTKLLICRRTRTSANG